MSESQATPSTAKVQRDDEFYFQDIIFLVEDRRFKVPARNFMAESEVFKTMFKLPQNSDIAADGLSDHQPLRLEGVKRDDFRQLLRVMYPSCIAESETLTMKQWVSVLELSTRWDMTKIRALAIRRVRAALAPDDLPHELLNLGQAHRVDEWVIDAVVSFVKRRESMWLDDVQAIGIENVLKIGSIRENITVSYEGERWFETTDIRIKQCFGVGLATT